MINRSSLRTYGIKKKGVKATGLNRLFNEILSGHYTNLEKENGPPNTEAFRSSNKHD